MTEEEIFAEATSVYDNYVEALETGTFEALQAYARNLSERIIPRGVETHEVVGIVLVAARRAGPLAVRQNTTKTSTSSPHPRRLRAGGQPYREHGAVGFVQERERIIRQQQEAIRSCPRRCCRCGNAC